MSPAERPTIVETWYRCDRCGSECSRQRSTIYPAHPEYKQRCEHQQCNGTLVETSGPSPEHLARARERAEAEARVREAREAARRAARAGETSPAPSSPTADPPSAPSSPTADPPSAAASGAVDPPTSPRVERLERLAAKVEAAHPVPVAPMPRLEHTTDPKEEVGSFEVVPSQPGPRPVRPQDVAPPVAPAPPERPAAGGRGMPESVKKEIARIRGQYGLFGPKGPGPGGAAGAP